ncbi:carbohydrate ABC transporter permease [Dactylosporangium sp. NPDC049140]|uniref:carbohydrate ABC transporter permease n=1 Tax=Dactylosporangium sp. NPDC049140 TaxID=3155647 RepID=UPI003411D40C
MTRPIWEERPTALGQAGKGVALTVVLALLVVPVYSVVLTSLSDQASINVAGGMVLVPHHLTLESYRQIFGNTLILHSVVVSLLITAVGTALSMVVTILCAYGLSRRGSFAHRTLLMTLIVTMFFSGGIIPTFIVVSALGGYDSYWSLILPSAVSVFNIIVMRGFFMNTAQELIDSARLDGAGEWRTLWSVVLPISRPVVAVITLFYAVGYWNSFFNALLYLPDNGKWPLQMIVYTYTLLGNPTPGTGITGGQLAGHQALAPLSIQMAVVSLTLVPILFAYPFVQRHFVKGMLIGAIKG